MFVLAPVTIGDRVVMNHKVGVEPDTIIGDDVELQAGTTVERGITLLPGKTYANAPIELYGDTDVAEIKSRHGTRRAVNHSFTTILYQVIGMLFYLSVWIGGLSVGLWGANEAYKVDHYAGYSFLLAAVPVIMIAFFCLAIPIIKWIVLGKVEEGRSHITPELLAAHWLLGRFMSTCSWTIPLIGTPALNNMLYWTMGLTYGRQCQGTFANFSAAMDLVKMGDRVWLGANNVVVPWYFEGHEMVFKEVRFEDQAVCSPNVITLAGSTVRSGGVLGPSSVLGPNGEVQQGMVYMNRAPKMKSGGGLAEQAPADTGITTSGYFFFQVFCLILASFNYVLLFACAIPAAIFYQKVLLEETRVDSWTLTENPGHWKLIPLEHWGVVFIPLLVFGVLLVFTVVCAPIVWLTRRRQNGKSKHFLDFRFAMFLWEGHMSALNLFSVTHTTSLLTRGTELGPILCRLYGAKIGRNVYWDNFQPTEFDMLVTGDNCAFDGCDIFMHSVVGIKSSYVFTQEPVIVGDNCVLRPGSYPLPPVLMGNNCVLGTNAIVMKNDAVPDDGYACGNPARVVQDVSVLYGKSPAMGV